MIAWACLWTNSNLPRADTGMSNFTLAFSIQSNTIATSVLLDEQRATPGLAVVFHVLAGLIS
jgi:hypothetical protein